MESITRAFLDNRDDVHDLAHHSTAPAATASRSADGSVPGADGNSRGGLRLLVGCIGFALGAIVCLVLAVIEFAAWVLIAPPRSILSGDFRPCRSGPARAGVSR